MPHYLIIYRPPRETFADDANPEEIAVIERHFEYLKQLLSEEKLLLAGRAENGRLGIGVIAADDEPAARTIMESDPVLTEGVFSGELLPFRLALFSGE